MYQAVFTHSSSAIDSVATKLVIISYNLHDLNQGKNGINELISTVEPDFIMLQEHWLTPENMYKLSELSTKYSIFGSSAMGDRVSSGPLIGRPFGGTAIMVNNKYLSVTTNLISSDQYTAIAVNDLLLICSCLMEFSDPLVFVIFVPTIELFREITLTFKSLIHKLFCCLVKSGVLNESEDKMMLQGTSPVTG